MNRSLSEKNRRKAIKENKTHFHGICWCENESKTLNIKGWCFECAMEDAELYDKKEDIRATDDIAHFEDSMKQQGITDENQRREIWENNYRY